MKPKLIILFAVLIFAAIISGSFSEIFGQSWSKLNTTGAVPELKNHTAVYDPAGNRMLVFGGRKADGNISSELWSLNLANNTWSQLNPSGQVPPARFTHNAYYDSAGARMIIWSGQGVSAAVFNDVWAYNFGSNSWQQLWADGNISGVPLKRYGAASVFNPADRTFTTFAGFTTSGRFEDTWTFQVDNLVWNDRTNNPHPPKRCLHSSVLANESGKFIIYAGQDTGPLDDIWSCNLSNFQWTNITPAVKPGARFFNSIIYTGNGNIIIFGGLGTVPFGDMWKFSLASNLWESVNQGTGSPSARWGHSGIYVKQQDRMIIFGGEGDSNYSHTWQFTNASSIGINQIHGIVPQKFSLEQNYPNPFNPSTKIRFQIPLLRGVDAEGGRGVSLIIYDMLGREITRLVNEQLAPGNYTVDFDGSNLSSGIYYYVMKTENFSDSKKMILIK